LVSVMPAWNNMYVLEMPEMGGEVGGWRVRCFQMSAFIVAP